MQVTPSDGQEHYWRGRTYDLYTGAGWQSSLEERTQPAVDAGPDADGVHEHYNIPSILTPGDVSDAAAPTMTALFRVLGDTSQFYYAANPRQIILGPEATRYGQSAREGADGRLDLVSGGHVQAPYAVVSQPAPDAANPETQDRLRRAGTDYPPEVRRLYLSASGSGITRPADLAFFQQAVAEAVPAPAGRPPRPAGRGAGPPHWVSRRCVYSLAPPPIPDDDDHVRYFLNNKRRGYCDMFASSLAILCRTAEFPPGSRPGSRPATRTATASTCAVEDKHAWTESLLSPARAGWPLMPRRGLSPMAPSCRQRAGAWRLAGLAQSAPGGSGRRLGLGVPLACRHRADRRLCFQDRGLRPLARVPPARLRPGAASVQAPRRALGRRYARLTRALAGLGLARRPTETPAEYAARAVLRLPLLEQEYGVSLSRPFVFALTDAFTQACYAPAGSPAGGAERVG